MCNIENLTDNVIRNADRIYKSHIELSCQKYDAYLIVHYYINGARAALVCDDNISADDFSEFSERMLYYEVELFRRSIADEFT